jgi:hypothetical protein
MITGEDYGVIAGKMCRVHRTLASLHELSTLAGLTLSFVKLEEVLGDVKISIPKCHSPDSHEDGGTSEYEVARGISAPGAL